jgi:hypothetical protein
VPEISRIWEMQMKRNKKLPAFGIIAALVRLLLPSYDGTFIKLESIREV